MLTRSNRSSVTFNRAFTLGDRPHAFQAGTYEIIVEEELLQGLSFEAYRHTATYLMIRGHGNHAGQSTMHMTTKEDLEHAMVCDRAPPRTTKHSDAALSPLEDTT